MVSIKKLDECAVNFDFNNELQLARVQHNNLVKLLGWCIHGKERILVYEFADRGSLHHYIFGMFAQWNNSHVTELVFLPIICFKENLISFR